MPSLHPAPSHPEEPAHTLDAGAIWRALEIRDLTDPTQGPHALQRLLDEVEQALVDRWKIPLRRERDHPVVSVAANYDRIGYPRTVRRETPATRDT